MAAIVLLSALAGMGLVRLDQLIQLNPSPSRVWLYGGTAESAMSLLSAVAGVYSSCRRFGLGSLFDRLRGGDDLLHRIRYEIAAADIPDRLRRARNDHTLDPPESFGVDTA